MTIHCPDCNYVGDLAADGENECPNCGICQGCYNDPCTCMPDNTNCDPA